MGRDEAVKSAEEDYGISYCSDTCAVGVRVGHQYEYDFDVSDCSRRF